jgi:two-component system, OmpR family, response regulator VicR
MRRRILIVPDQDGMSPSVQEAMSKETFDPILVKGLQNVLRAVRDHRPGLVLFEVQSLGVPLKELLWKMEELRSTQAIRKVILAATGAMDDKVCALDMGADDFLTKPISARELELRILAAMRANDSVDDHEDTQSFGSMRLYRESMEVSISESRTKLSPREFNMLAYMMDHAGQVLSRMDLLENLWFPVGEMQEHRVVDVYVLRLREKIEDDPSQPRRLLTRRGEGYCLVDPSRA